MIALTPLKCAVPLAVLLLLSGCGGAPNGDGKDAGTADTLDTTPKADAGLMKVGGKLFSVPSPLQTALLIKKLNLPYKKELPLALEAMDKMATNAQQALGMGAYGADLGYVAVHKDGQRALRTLEVVQKLSGQLQMSNAFDATLVEAFKKSMNNEDSLLRFTGMAFRAADRYLKVNDRNDVSAYVLAGGWVEGMYLTLSGAPEKPDQALIDRVGQQRHTLENMIALITEVDQEKSQATLVAALKDLLSAYQGVGSTYQYQAPTVDATHKTTYINSTSTITMSPEVLATIAGKVMSIRNMITA